MNLAHFAEVQKLNQRAKKRGGGSSDESDSLREHEQTKRKERAEYLERAVPAFFVRFRSELAHQVAELNASLFSHSDFLRVDGNQASLQDVLLTSNTEDWFRSEPCIEIGVAPSGEVREIIRKPGTQGATSIELILIDDPDGVRLVTDTTSYRVPEYVYSLIAKFLRVRQVERDARRK